MKGLNQVPLQFLIFLINTKYTGTVFTEYENFTIEQNGTTHRGAMNLKTTDTGKIIEIAVTSNIVSLGFSTSMFVNDPYWSSEFNGQITPQPGETTAETRGRFWNWLGRVIIGDRRCTPAIYGPGGGCIGRNVYRHHWLIGDHSFQATTDCNDSRCP